MVREVTEEERQAVNWHPLSQCGVCPLARLTWRTNFTPVCYGKGPETADIVIVGEAPGEDEAVHKQPFFGRSGRLLNQALKQVGLDREAIYVTNAALCHPENNKTPAAKAIKACQARLLDEVRQRKPRVVVCVGGTAAKAFGLEGSITSERGREHWVSVDDLRGALQKGRSKREAGHLHFSEEWDGGGVYVLPTFHPAYCLRNPDVYQDLVKDLEHAKDLAQQAAGQTRVVPTPTTHVPRSVPEALRWIRRIAACKGPVACDIESRSKDYPFDRWEEALLTLAYAWYERDGELHALVLPSYTGPLNGPNDWGRGDVHPSWDFVGRDIGQRRMVRDALRELHQQKRPRIVGWNLKFDAKWYRKALGFWLTIGGDGMLIHYLLDERRGIHGLKERASDDLGAADYEKEIKGFTGSAEKYDMGKVPFEKLVEYTAQDVGMTLMLTPQYEAEGKEVDEGDPYYVYKNILLPAANALARVEYNGVEVNVKALRNLDADFQALLDGYVQEMRDMSGVPTLNPSSTPQLVQVLYGDEVRKQYGVTAQTAEGLPTFLIPVYLNDRRTPGTGADICDKILTEQGEKLPDNARRMVTALRSYRLDAQLYRTYIRKLPRVVDRFRRVHTNLNLHIARTGRLSSSDPVNLQNIPTRRKEGKQIKQAFQATTNRKVREAWLREQGLGPDSPEWAEPWVMWEVDMSQCELRTAAFVSGDPIMAAIYQQNRDFHHEVGVQLLGSDQLARELRPFIKTFNFALLYGAEDAKLTQLLNDTAMEEEARSGQPQKRWAVHEVAALTKTFRQQFPIFNTWALATREEAFETGQVRTFFRRRRRWSLITPQTVNDLNKESVNTKIQGPASDLVLEGLTRVVNALENHTWTDTVGRVLLGRVLLSVHDSIVGESPVSHAKEVALRVKALLELIPAELGMTVPFKADMKLGPNWADLKELEANP